MFAILLIVSSLLPSPSILHYTFPPTWCQLANLCNHTGIPRCAKEGNKSQIRMFLDKCDMYEYNCDNREAYNIVNMTDCQQTTEVTDQSTTPTISETAKQRNISQVPIGTHCTRHTKITTSMTTSSFDSAMCKTTSSTTLTTETVTETTIQKTLDPTESTSEQTVTTDSKPPTTETTIMESTITETTTMEATTTETTTTKSTTTEPTTTIFTTTEPTTTTPFHTIKDNCTRNVNKTIPTTQMMYTTKNQNIPPVTESMTTVATMMTTVEYEEVEATTVKQQTTSPGLIVCDNYPKDCNRPLTWVTTAKGETRDYYQILRAKFGNRIKLLRATTHWPRRYIPYDTDGNFIFGRHSES